jgi:Flp pilus assembly protein CpaB
LLAAITISLGVAFWPHQLPAFGHLLFRESTDSVPVLVARRYISAFQMIKPEDIRIRSYPKEYVPSGALHAASELLTETGQPSFSSLVAVPQGEPMTRTVLVDTNRGQGLSSLLRLGSVAVSFSIDKSRAAGGWIQPGDTVALFEAAPIGPAGRGTAARRTRLLLSAVKVLAVDKMRLGQRPDPENKAESLQALSAGESDTLMITVLVSPVQAKTVVEARERGPISVVLRAMGDDLPWAMEE